MPLRAGGGARATGSTCSGWSEDRLRSPARSCGLGDVHGLGDERLAALVGQPDHGGVDLEQLDERPVATASSVSLEREALRERARDLVERGEPPRRDALGLERPLPLGRRAASSPRAGRAFWTATAIWPASAASSADWSAVSARPRGG